MRADKPSLLAPKLRFPEFRDVNSWRATRLNELLHEAKHRNRTLELGPADVLSVSGEHGCVNQIEFMGRSYAGVTVKDYHVVERGDIVYTKSPLKKQPYGIIKANKVRRGIVSTLYAVYRPLPGSSATYLDHYFARDYRLNAYLQPIVKKGAKNDMKVNNADVLKGHICVPELEEQQKIVDCLDSLDDVIAKEGRNLQALRRHKQGLMQKLFPRPGETVPRLRFPEFQDTSDWETGSCRDIAEVLPGCGFPDKFQGNKTGQYPFYKVSDISQTIEKGARHISAANNYINADVLQEIRGKTVPAGTIIFAKIGEAIRSNRRVVTTTPAVIDNNTAGVIALSGKSLNEFLFYLWSNVSLIDHGGGLVPSVSKSALENVPLCYPVDLAEQQRIADCLVALDDQLDAQTRKLGSLRQHKQALLQQLFPSPEASE